MRRRQLLATIASAAAATTIASTARADAPFPEQPGHVTLAYDDAKSEIEDYQPRLILRSLGIEPSALYAWRATSVEYDLDWYVYIAWYPAGQEGLADEDSHVPDREPVYVAVDPNTGDIQRVLYDQIHYFVGRTSPTTAHPRLHVVHPWHNYRPTDEEGRLIELRDLRDRYEDWLALGWDIHERCVVDPPSVRARGHWWPSNALGFSLTAQVTRAILGLRDAGIDAPVPSRRT